MEPRNYKNGDVVWVMPSKRLGWWPGRVENVEELRQDLARDVTDKTIAVVKYLNEDCYQFVEDESIISAYDSIQKEDYISIGMKKYYEKKRLKETSNPFMKFADSIRQAEKLIGGNPDVVDDEKFQLKKSVPAQSKYKNIFVDPRIKEAKAKPSMKGTTNSPRRPGRPTAKEATTSRVNHPRFQGQSDHEVRIRRQEKSPVTGGTGFGAYRCDSCTFQTARLNLMVLHKKTEHLSSSSPVASVTPKQKTAQKRPSSPTKKTVSKRSKINTEPDGDLFDQVKRNLESKEIDSKHSLQPRTSTKIHASPRTTKTPKSPKTPKTPRTPRSTKVSATVTSTKSPTAKPSDHKTQFNPKKKWLNSLKKEANPEVKNKLMADWEESDEEEKQQQNNRTEISLSTVAQEAEAESDSDNDLRPSSSGLLHQRSDDEEDEDDAMETEPLNVKSPEKFIKNDDDASNTEESFIAGISAEIDKLNADLDATNREKRSSKINGDPVSTNKSTAKKELMTTSFNGVEPSSPDTSTRGEEEIKLGVASLLAETSVPTIPNLTELSKTIEKDVSKASSTPSQIKGDMDQGVVNDELENARAEQPIDEEEMNPTIKREIDHASTDVPSVKEEIDQAVENEVDKSIPEQAVEKEEIAQLKGSNAKPFENPETSANISETHEVVEEEQKAEIAWETSTADKEVTVRLPEAGSEIELTNEVETIANNIFETVTENMAETAPNDVVEAMQEDIVETADDRIEALPEDRIEALPEDRIEALPEDRIEALPEDRIEALPEEIEEAIPEDIEEAIPEEIEEPKPEEIEELKPEEIEEPKPDEIEEAIPEEIEEAIPEEIEETIPEEIEETIPEKIEEAILEEKEEAIPATILGTVLEKTVKVIDENGVENVVENGVVVVTDDSEVLTSENGEATDVVATNGSSNILMQVEGGETYMVVWEPDTNIQEFLACGGEGDDGSTGATQTLLIDPSSLQAGSDLENLFQMAVAASAASQPQHNEQSHSTTSVCATGGRRSYKGTPEGTPTKGNKPKLRKVEELLNKHGDAVAKELKPDTVVWSVINSSLFLPGAVVESSNTDTLTLVAFDVERPNNQRKYRRNRVISAFHHELNLEILAFGRSKNKASVCKKLNLSFDHASSFVELRSKPDFTELTAQQYLVSCHRSPVKLFSERYLTSSPLDEFVDLPKPLEDSDSADEVVLDANESRKKRQIVDIMLEQHVLTDACLQHLADFVTSPSEERAFRLDLYKSQNWHRLKLSATTSGILGNSRELYSKLADFLHENVHRVQELQEKKDRKRAFILDLLLPEALIYGVQKTFPVTYQEAMEIVVYGVKDHDQYYDKAT